MQRGEENRWLSQLPFPAPSPFPFKETQTLSMLFFTVCSIVYYIFHHDKVKVIHLNDSLSLLLFIYFIVQHLPIAAPPPTKLLWAEALYVMPNRSVMPN